MQMLGAFAKKKDRKIKIQQEAKWMMEGMKETWEHAVKKKKRCHSENQLRQFSQVWVRVALNSSHLCVTANFLCSQFILHESLKNTTPHHSFSGTKHSNKSCNTEIKELVFPSGHNKCLRNPCGLVAAPEECPKVVFQSSFVCGHSSNLSTRQSVLLQ